ncbi:MAG: tetratricopeptide repeat protein [Deltaproteobacteria bacterium]|nr:tetratricopeptide repeat protein [Deltaproteobacteria bacterium]
MNKKRDRQGLALFLVAGLCGAGCAGLSTTKPLARPVRPRPPAVDAAAKPTKETLPDGVPREVVRLETPQLAAARTPQRTASMELVMQGKQFLARREHDRALKAFQDAVMVDGTNGIAYYYLARVRYELRQYTEAVGLLERAAALLADSPEWMRTVEELQERIRLTQHSSASRRTSPQ